MKKIYSKPILKFIDLDSSELLMTGSNRLNIYTEGGSYGSGDEALCNEEGGYDIWGNEDNDIW